MRKLTFKYDHSFTCSTLLQTVSSLLKNILKNYINDNYLLLVNFKTLKVCNMLLKAKSSSDDDGDDDEPLSSYRASRPSSVQEKLQTEEQMLAQYKAGRDA